MYLTFLETFLETLNWNLKNKLWLHMVVTQQSILDYLSLAGPEFVSDPSGAKQNC